MKKNFKKSTFVMGIFMLMVLVFLTQTYIISDAQAADKASLRFQWKVSANHTPFVVAMGKGFYKEENIDITIKEGAGSTATLKLIGANEDTFAFCESGTAVKGIAKGVPAIQIMVGASSKEPGIILRPEAGVREPKDLIGKTIAGTGGGVSDMFQAFLDANGIDKDKVEYVAAGGGALEALVSKRADGVLANIMNDVIHLKGMGMKAYQTIYFRDYGVPDPGDGILVHLDTYEKHSDLIRRFVKASIRGINHAFMDIDETVNIVLKYFPMANKEILLAQLKVNKWLFAPPVGWQDPKVMEALKEFVIKYAATPEARNIPLNRFFTNEFLPRF